MEGMRLVRQGSSSVCFALGPSQATGSFDTLGTNKQTRVVLAGHGAGTLIDAGRWLRDAGVKVILAGDKGMMHVKEGKPARVALGPWTVRRIRTGLIIFT